MTRKCPRTLDKPLLLFGLEVEDIGFLSLLGGLGSILFDPMIPGVLTIAGWIVLTQFKKDKPAGYLIHWLYTQGIDFPGLIPPVKKAKHYCIYGSTRSTRSPLVETLNHPASHRVLLSNCSARGERTTNVREE